MTRSRSPSLAESPAVLMVLDNRDLIDVLSHVLEERDFSVCVARSGPAAVAFLRSGCRFDAVLAAWDAGRGVGESLLGWLQEKRPKLVSRFIALVDVEPHDFQAVTQGRCHMVHSFDLAEIVRVTTAVVTGEPASSAALQRADAGSSDLNTMPESSAPPIAVAPAALAADERPSLLLVEDEPLQQDIMSQRLGRLGFAVTVLSSGHAAASSLTEEDYDVILCDWYMRDGSGAELYSWLIANRPHMADRCVFTSASASPDELTLAAPKRPFVPKSAGTIALLGYLTGIASRSRSQSIGFMAQNGQ